MILFGDSCKIHEKCINKRVQLEAQNNEHEGRGERTRRGISEWMNRRLLTSVHYAVLGRIQARVRWLAECRKQTVENARPPSARNTSNATQRLLKTTDSFAFLNQFLCLPRDQPSPPFPLSSPPPPAPLYMASILYISKSRSVKSGR